MIQTAEIVLTQFLADIGTHQMQIDRDDGVNRHIRFRRPETGAYWFDIITMPGKLCFFGDMGNYVFSRLPDMFEFFRTDRNERAGNDSLNPRWINRGYWSEKLIAIDRSGFKAYDGDRFRTAIADWLNDADDVTDEMREEIEEEVLSHAEDGQHAAVAAAMNYRYEGRQVFQDFYEVTLTDYTFGFTWVCYAIAYAIAQYDLLKGNALPCAWEPLEPGLNLAATSLSAGDTADGKWMLFSRGDAGAWNERTKALAPPSQDYMPVRTSGVWLWKTKAAGLAPGLDSENTAAHNGENWIIK